MPPSMDDEEDAGDIEIQPGIVFTRLNEMVRKKYFSYLENLLSDNYKAWCLNESNVLPGEIHKCAEILEDNAIKACLMVQFYRKAMIKIIANIRRNTKECRLQSQLKSLIEQRQNAKTFLSKCTQTDDTSIKTEIDVKINNENFTPSLEEKIKNFEKTLTIKKVASDVVQKLNTKTERLKPNYRKRKLVLSPDRKHIKDKEKKQNKPCRKPISALKKIESPICETPNETKSRTAQEDDNIAKELAILFREEKSEIDELFGFNTDEEPYDPQIDNILKEIESSKLSHERKNNENTQNTAKSGNIEEAIKIQTSPATKKKEIEAKLSDSIWPCEFHMQRQKLSEILFRLIDEDIRWHELIQWKFIMLFGEDSDDEFAVYSPSIELNEVLINSCMKRIAPWMVKHLMRPMNDGLIGNRYLFKKLAKKLSRSIILQNQYPDEELVKIVVEEFFCLHQNVTSTADFEIILPSIKD